ncbi:MAG: hypothetical protein RLZ92_1629, partial [Pseudomonadota bacterium]
MSVLAPTGELLSFAWPKESNQRKGHPTAAFFLRSETFTGVGKRDFLSLCQLAASMRQQPYSDLGELFPVKVS